MTDIVDGAEGFICPYCLVNFASSAKLQQHFLEFHSGVEESEDTEEEGYKRMDGEDEVLHNVQLYGQRPCGLVTLM